MLHLPKDYHNCIHTDKIISVSAFKPKNYQFSLLILLQIGFIVNIVKGK